MRIGRERRIKKYSRRAKYDLKKITANNDFEKTKKRTNARETKNRKLQVVETDKQNNFLQKF